jgi:hypothetical protein
VSIFENKGKYTSLQSSKKENKQKHQNKQNTLFLKGYESFANS